MRSETDTFVSQEEIDLERCKGLLRLLAHDRNAGIASDACGVNCVYCDWQDEDYRAEPRHMGDCPIRKARTLLLGG